MSHIWCLRCSPWTVFATFAIFTISMIIFISLPSLLLEEEIYDPHSLDVEVVPTIPKRGPDYPPMFAYWISGTHGDYKKMIRLLKAVYHPRNRYLLHLDAGASAYERRRLANTVWSEQIFHAFGNVDVIGKANPVDQRGASAVAATLHGAAVLLKISPDWDWFITLNASDYPLVTQDDILYAFSSVPRDLNFIDHRPDSESRQIIVVDPNLHLDKKTEISYSSEYRAMPDAFEIFRGSPGVILSRSFIERCVFATDNLPRKLLLYFSNTLNPMESYFQTIIGNSVEFPNNTINNNFRFIIPDTSSSLNHQTQYETMINSGAAFAGQFKENDRLLEEIDKDILKRPFNGVTPGEWCPRNEEGPNAGLNNECSIWADIDAVKQGLSGKRMANLMSDLVEPCF